MRYASLRRRSQTTYEQKQSVAARGTSPLTRHDEAAFLAAARRSRKLHGCFAHPPVTTDRFRAALERQRDASHEGFLVVNADSDELIGVINLNEIVRGPSQSAYLGYYAFEPHAG